MPEKLKLLLEGTHKIFSIKESIFAGFVRRVAAPSSRAGCGAFLTRRFSFQVSFFRFIFVFCYVAQSFLFLTPSEICDINKYNFIFTETFLQFFGKLPRNSTFPGAVYAINSDQIWFYSKKRRSFSTLRLYSINF